MRYAIRRPEKMRRLLDRRRKDPELKTRLKEAVARKQAVEEMQRSSHGWKIISEELNKEMDRLMHVMADPQTADEEIALHRRSFLAAGIVRAIMSRIFKSGQEAERELKLLGAKEDQHG